MKKGEKITYGKRVKWQENEVKHLEGKVHSERYEGMKRSGVYKVSYNLLFFPTPFFSNLDFLPPNYAPFPL